MSKKKKRSSSPNLTSKNKPEEETPTLTRHSEGVFKVAFIGAATQRRYRFKDCTPNDWYKVGKFLDKWVGKPVLKVNSLKKRSDDEKDILIIEGEEVQINHYEFENGGRLHGYNSGGYFIVTRIDPNHKFHK